MPTLIAGRPTPSSIGNRPELDQKWYDFSGREGVSVTYQKAGWWMNERLGQ